MQIKIIALGVMAMTFGMVTVASAETCRVRNPKGGILYGKECKAFLKKYDAQKAKCEQVKKDVVLKLGYSSLPDYHRQKKSWMEKATLYGALATDANLTQIKSCQEVGFFPRGTHSSFERNRKTIKTTWTEVVTDLGKDSLNFQTLSKHAKKKGDSMYWLNVLEPAIAEIEAVKLANKTFKADTTALDKRHTRLLAMRGKVYEDIEKQLKKTKCPRDKNRKMSKKLGPLVKAHFLKGTHPKDIKKFVVQGKPYKKRIAFKRITHQNMPGFACFVAKHKPSKPFRKCGFYSVSVRRTKIDGQKWGPYEGIFVGPVKYMSCKNVK